MKKKPDKVLIFPLSILNEGIGYEKMLSELTVKVR